MDKKTIKPFTLLTLLTGLALSLWLAITVITAGYLSNRIMYIILAILGVGNIICLLIGLLSRHTWPQAILSILLVLVSAVGLYANRVVTNTMNQFRKVFTEIPETTDHSVYLLNHSYYMIIDEVDNREIETAVLEHYNTCDIDPLVKGLAEKNATLKITGSYKSISTLFSDWFRYRSDHVTHLLLSTILPDELVELSGEIFNTEIFLSGLKVKYQYTEEVSTGLNNDEKPDVALKPYTVLIGGNDARGIKTDEDFLNRSDTNFLLTVNPITRKILLTVLPLDPIISINGNPDSLSYASFYGISCWENCVEELMGVDVDYFARFNYSKIAELIDDYGSITVNNPYGFRTYRDIRTEDGWENPAWYFDGGDIQLTGDKALVYLRELNHLANGHDARFNNILRVFSGLWEKVKPEIDDISFKQEDSIKNTLVSYKNNLQKCLKLLDKIEGGVATDIDTHKLMTFIIKDIMSSDEKWSFEYQLLNADYSRYPCFSANDAAMFCGNLYEEELKTAVRKIHDVLGN